MSWAKMLALLLLAALDFLNCGGVASTPSQPLAGQPPPGQTAAPSFQNVFVVVLENQSYGDVLGSSAMPYLNSLASQYALATQYYANTHPSMGDYFMLTTGQIISNDDGFSGTVDADNVVRQLTRAGKSWRAYLESLPSAGYTGGDVYPYIKHHNPFAYLSDVLNNDAQKANLVPFSQFASDLSNSRLPRYSFIVPNNQDNGHDCPAGMLICSNADKLRAADTWLHDNLGPLINSASFQKSGLLIITFDEAAVSDTTNGGGHIVHVLIGPGVKGGFQSNSLYQHPSTLRLMLEGLGVNSWPGAAAAAPGMGQFFR